MAVKKADKKYNRKQIALMMEQYAMEQLAERSFEDLPVKFRFEVSQYGKAISCHLRTTQGILVEIDELVAWFEKLSETKRTEILAA